jgi:hypothetical protein
VNDVLLDVTAGGLRGLLTRRGESVEDVSVLAYVPVSLHHEPGGSARGNFIAQMTVPLPIGIGDPLERLHAIAEAFVGSATEELQALAAAAAAQSGTSPYR